MVTSFPIGMFEQNTKLNSQRVTCQCEHVLGSIFVAESHGSRIFVQSVDVG